MAVKRQTLRWSRGSLCCFLQFLGLYHGCVQLNRAGFDNELVNCEVTEGHFLFSPHTLTDCSTAAQLKTVPFSFYVQQA